MHARLIGAKACEQKTKNTKFKETKEVSFERLIDCKCNVNGNVPISLLPFLQFSMAGDFA